MFLMHSLNYHRPVFCHHSALRKNKQALCPGNTVIEFRLGPARKHLTKVSVGNSHSLGDDLPRLFHGMLFAVRCYAQKEFEERLESGTAMIDLLNTIYS